jgi:hypothetical protein
MRLRTLLATVPLLVSLTPFGPLPDATATGCTSYAAPDAKRPVVWNTVDVAADHASLSGHERVKFTPDKDISRLVFRMIPNSPNMKSAGSLMRVHRLVVSGPVQLELRPTTNTTTTLSIALGRTVRAGTTVTTDLWYGVRLPASDLGRVGHANGVAWWGSGAPLLSWERGIGWATQPATTLWGEIATSEEFKLAGLAISAPSADVVFGTGHKDGKTAMPGGRTRHHFVAAAVRDIAGAAGPLFPVRRSVDGVQLTVGTAPGVSDNANHVADRMAAAMRAHAARFGPFPYTDLWVPVLPRFAGGIEYPGFIMMGPGEADDATASHEVAHEWFYGLIGDNQARDPWLDEAFATYAEALHRGTGGSYENTSVPSAGYRRVGAPMSYWEQHQSAYYRSVYVQGAAALLKARRAAGAGRFDYAIRCYVNVYAHRVARPSFVASALASMPEAKKILVFYGALAA